MSKELVVTLDVGFMEQGCTTRKWESTAKKFKNGVMFVHDCYTVAAKNKRDFLAWYKTEFDDNYDNSFPILTTKEFIRRHVKALREHPDLILAGEEVSAGVDTQGLLGLYYDLYNKGVPEAEGRRLAAKLADRLEKLIK
jgi:hypothetical protein